MKPGGGGGGGRGQSPARKGGGGGGAPASRLPRAVIRDGRLSSGGSSSDSGVTRGPPGGSPGASRGGSDDSLYGSSGGDQSLGGSSVDPFTPEDNINVVVRVRPLGERELRRNDPAVVSFPGNGQIQLDGVGVVPGGQNKAGSGGGGTKKLFSYNVVFEPGATQEDVFQFSGVKRLVEMAVQGFGTTVFCYGQTGSGKTHTLTGPPPLFGDKSGGGGVGVDQLYSADHGLVFRTFMYLFQTLQHMTDKHFVLKASFLEIYNEKVIDLLNPGSARKPLAVRWSKKTGGFFVENLFTVDCEELDDLLAVLEEGMRNRSVGRHSMNEHSSRSHTMLTVTITSEQQMENNVFVSKQGKINFVDLAGSEMTKKTHSEGKTLEEANNINKSLMVLGYCIASLSDQKKRTGHIPYRDSKLTKLLADSLAGSGVTLMVACVSPARSNVTETLNTLRYAARAKRIRAKPVVVMDTRDVLIVSLKREVSALQEENEHLRTALHLSAEYVADSSSRDNKLQLKTPPNLDLEKIASMDGGELAELVRHYAKENEALRRENGQLFDAREVLVRDQEIVCRENERLIRKLEDISVVDDTTSPMIAARGGGGGDANGNIDDGQLFNLSGSNVWATPNRNKEAMDSKSAKPPHRLPDSIQKELDKRQIGKTLPENIRDRSVKRTPASQGAAMNGGGGRHRSPQRRTPTAKDPFGSLLSLHEEEVAG